MRESSASKAQLDVSIEPPIDIARTAFFLDLDGTLAPIAATPDSVRVPKSLRTTLSQLQQRTDGALAVISGRPISQIDQLLAPLELAAAGLHGAEWRDALGQIEQLAIDPQRVAAMASTLVSVAAADPGLLLERKALALALHFRNAPAQEFAVRQAMTALAARNSDAFVLQAGKMVFEIKPKGASKGAALRQLMQQEPFTGRRPLFAGDDLTDESAFEAVNTLGGISIKIGPGPTLARARLPSPAALAAWLAQLL